MFQRAETPQIIAELACLRRPRLLIRAARCGQDDYSRGRDLKRLVDAQILNRPEAVLLHLYRTEAQLDEERRAGVAHYDLTRHVEVLIALMAEARGYLV